MANEVRRRGNAGNTGSTGNTADGAPSTSAIANASAPPLSASATSPPPSSLTDKQRLAEFKRRQQQQRTLTSSSTTTSSSSPTSTVTSRNRHRTPRILWFLGLTIASLITRFAYLHRPDQVVFDEVHFGKFGSFYLRREFYFDVHPPYVRVCLHLCGCASVLL